MKKYNQDDAQFICDWFNAVNSLHIGFINPELRKAFEKADQIRMKLHQEILDNSNYILDRTKSGKAKLVKEIIKFNLKQD